MRAHKFLPLLVLTACTRTDVVPPINPDADKSAAPYNSNRKEETTSFTLDTVLTPTSLATIKVSGRSKASRLVIRGGLHPVMVTTLPGSQAFCADVPLSPNSQATLEVMALDNMGGLGPETKSVEVRQDPRALPPPSPTCDGQAPGCKSAEICNNGSDDDCNGLADGRDPACRASCQDDVYERNDGVNEAPILELQSYIGLTICPGNEDWFTARVLANQTLLVSVQYQPMQGDIDLEVRRPDGTVAGLATEQMPNLKGIALPQLPAGLYGIRVRGINAQVRNTYNLFATTQ